MKIYKDKKNLIIKRSFWSPHPSYTIPLRQISYDAIDNPRGEIDNVIGMVDGEKLGFAQVIDLGYKGSFDYGDFIVEIPMVKEEFKRLCNKLNIIYFEWPTCSICKKTIYGTFTIGKGGNECFDCSPDYCSSNS